MVTYGVFFNKGFAKGCAFAQFELGYLTFVEGCVVTIPMM